MIINLVDKHYSFNDFLLEDNIIQGIIEFTNKYTNKSGQYYLHKLQERNGAYSIFVINICKEVYVTSEYDNYRFLLSIDNKNKIIIHEGNDCLLNIEEKLRDLKDYKIWGVYDLSMKMQEEYKYKIRTLFDKHTQDFKDKFKEYEEKYNDVLNNNRRYVEADYANEQCNYELDLPDLEAYTGNGLESLQNYLQNPHIVDRLVNEFFIKETIKYECDSYLSRHAEKEANKELLKQIKEQPSEYLKLYLNIKEAIKDGGKTLNIIIKNDEKIKVYNELNYYYGFNTVRGYNNCKIEDIQKITFGKDTLFSNDTKTC